jgi:hypothetical protein
MIAAIGHVWATPGDPTDGGMASASHKVPLSQLSEPVSVHSLAQLAVAMRGCIWHVHSAYVGCTIDAVTSSLSCDPPDRIWRVSRWIETDSRLKGGMGI